VRKKLTLSIHPPTHTHTHKHTHTQVRKDLASAELLYRMGLEENPEHVGILYNFRCVC
jgi:hypothetical protein